MTCVIKRDVTLISVRFEATRIIKTWNLEEDSIKKLSKAFIENTILDLSSEDKINKFTNLLKEDLKKNDFSEVQIESISAALKDAAIKLINFKVPEDQVVDSPKEGVIPPDMGESVTPIKNFNFEGFPQLKSDFDQTFKIKITEATYIDFENERPINTTEDLNNSLKSLQNTLFADLVTFLNSTYKTNFSADLFVDGEVQDIQNYNKVMQYASNIFSKQGLPDMQTAFKFKFKSEYYNKLNAFYAYLVLNKNNFDTLLENVLGKTIKINRSMGRFPGLTQHKYRLILDKHKSAVFGDDSFTDAKVKAGSIARAIIESTPLLDTSGKEIAGSKLDLDRFIIILNKFKNVDMLNTLKDDANYNKFIQLKNDPIKSMQFILKSISEQLWWRNNFSLDLADIAILRSIYKRFYDPENPKSLYNIMAKQQNAGLPKLSFDYLQAVTQVFMRSDFVEYLISENDQPRVLHRNSQLYTRVRLEDQTEYDCNYNLIKSEQLKQKYGATLNDQDGSITFKLPEFSYKFTIRNNRQGDYNFTVEGIADDDASIKKFIQENIEVVSIKDMDDFYVKGEAKNFNNKQQLYLDLLEFINDALPGFNLIKNDLNALQLLKGETGPHYLYKKLFALATNAWRARIFSLDYFADTSDISYSNYIANRIVKYSQNDGNYFNSQTNCYKLSNNNTKQYVTDVAIALQKASGKLEKTMRDAQGNTVSNTRVSGQYVSVVKDLQDRTGDSSVINDTLINQNRNKVGHPKFLLDGTNSLGESKHIKKFNESEYIHMYVVQHYLNAYNTVNEQDEIPFYVQCVTYSDKTALPVYPMKLTGWKYNGQEYDFSKAEVSDILDIYRKSTGSIYKHTLENVLDDYRKTYEKHLSTIKERLESMSNLEQPYIELRKLLTSGLNARKVKLVTDIQDYINQLEKSLKSLGPGITADNRRTAINNEIESLKAQIREIKNSPNSYMLNTEEYKLILSVTSEEEFQDWAWEAGATNAQQMHYTGKTKVGDFTGLQVNNLLYYYATKLYIDDNLFNKKVEKERYKLLKDLLNNNFAINLYDSTWTKDKLVHKTIKKLKETYPKYEDEWINPLNQELILGKQDGVAITNLDQLKPNIQVELNPILDRYFATWLLLSSELRNIKLGTSLGHKAYVDPVLDEFGQFDEEATMEQLEAARENAANKRTVGQAVPIQTISQGDILSVQAVERIAVMPDIKAPVYTVNGEIAEVDSMDGSSLLNPVIAKLLNLGLQDNRVEEGAIKALAQSYLNKYGTAVLLKYATFSQYNSKLRNSIGSPVNLLAQFKKMMDFEWDQDYRDFPKSQNFNGAYTVDITKDLYGHKFTITKATKSKNLYYQKGTKFYKIESIKKASQPYMYEIKINQMQADGNPVLDSKNKPIVITNQVKINSNWDLFQALGGVYSGHFVDGTFVYDDSSLDTLVQYINSVGCIHEQGNVIRPNKPRYLTQNDVYQPLKGRMIASMINQSALKNGGCNINKQSTWYSEDPLKYFTIKSDSWGIVQDYDHVVTDGKSTLTEMSQVVSATTSGLKLFKLNERIFKAISNVSIYEVQDYIDAVKNFVENQKDPEFKSELYDIIGRYLVKDYERGDDIQSQLLKELKASFAKYGKKGHNNHKDDQYKIAFSLPETFAKYITVLGSTMNRLGIKRQYYGLGAIMTPAYNTACLFQSKPDKNNRTYQMTYSDLVHTVLNKVVNANNILYVNGQQQATISEGVVEVTDNSNLYELAVYLVDNVPNFTTTNEELLSILGTYFASNCVVNGQQVTVFKELNTEQVIKNYLDTYDKTEYSIDKLMPGDNVILIDPITKEERSVTVDRMYDPKGKDPFTYQALKKSNYTFRYDYSKPKNLQPCQITYKVNGVTKCIYDNPIIAQSFQEHQDVNTSLKLGQITAQQAKASHFEISKKTNKVLNFLDQGIEITLDELGNEVRQDITDLDVGSYEAILPKIYKTQFGLKEGDSLYDILQEGPNFFQRRWEENHIITKGDYDLCFTRNNGEHSYITFDKNVEVMEIDPEASNIVIKKDQMVLVDSEGDKICVLKIAKKDESGKILKDDDGNIIWENNLIPSAVDPNIFVAFNEKAAMSIYSSEEYDGIVLNENSLNKQTIKDIIIKRANTVTGFLPNVTGEENIQELNQLIQNRFKPKNWQNIFNSFKKSLELVVSRIPAQTLQSFMKMKVVAFGDTDKNTIQVSHWQIYLQGSDYDIDKAYTMAFEISKNGRFVAWSPFFNLSHKEAFKQSLKLPLPSLRPIQLGNKLDKGTDITDLLLPFVDAVNSDNPQLYVQQNLLQELKTLLEKTQDAIYYAYDKSKISADKIKLIKNLIIDKHNLYFENLNKSKDTPGLPSRKQCTAAFRNFIANGLMEVASSVVNASAAQTPVSMGETRTAADESDLGVDIKTSTNWIPTTVAKITKINMDGKGGIGVAANGEKCFFMLLYYCQNAIINGDEKALRHILFDKRFVINGKEINKNLISGLNFDYIKDIDIDFLLSKKGEIQQIIRQLHEDKVDSPEQLIQIVEDQLGVQPDQALVISALLSAATDNAKEMILSKINGDPEFMNMYLYGIIIGLDFTDISKFMTSNFVSSIIKLSKYNMFDTTQLRIKVQDIIDVLEGKDIPYMPNQSMLKKIPNFANISSIKTHLKEKLWEPSYNIEDDISDEVLMESYGQNYLYVRRQVYKFRELFKKLHSIVNSVNFDENFKTFKILQQGGQELTNFAKILSANQGFGVTLEDKLNFAQSLEQIFNNKIQYFKSDRVLDIEAENRKIRRSNKVKTITGEPLQAELKVPSKKDEILRNLILNGFSKEEADSLYKYAEDEGLLEGKFSIFKFLDPTQEKYRQVVVDLYNAVKTTFSLFYALQNIPHFKSMYDIMYYTREGDAAMTPKFELIANIKKQETFKNLTWDKHQYSAVRNGIDEQLIFKFIVEQNFTIPIKKDSYIFKNKKLVLTENDQLMPLNSLDSLATFKYQFEQTFVPNLKRGWIGGKYERDLEENFFIQNLELGSEKHPISGERIPILTLRGIDFSLINTPGPIKNMYEQALVDLRKLKEIEYNGMNLIDWFYLYNLAVYQDHYGTIRFQPIFSSMINESTIMRNYQHTYSDADYALDSSKYDDVSVEDIAIRTAPVILPHAGASHKEPYVKVWDSKLKSYLLFAKAGSSNMDIDIDDPMDDVEGAIKVPTYTEVFQPNDKVSRKYYTIMAENYEYNIHNLMLNINHSYSDLSKRFDNLIYKNIINLYIDC